jgi:hypothetical protein
MTGRVVFDSCFGKTKLVISLYYIALLADEQMMGSPSYEASDVIPGFEQVPNSNVHPATPISAATADEFAYRVTYRKHWFVTLTIIFMPLNGRQIPL